MERRTTHGVFNRSAQGLQRWPPGSGATGGRRGGTPAIDGVELANAWVETRHQVLRRSNRTSASVDRAGELVFSQE